MESISLGQIASFISLIGVFIGAIAGLIKFYRISIAKILNPLNQKVDKLEILANQNVKNLELTTIKTDLVKFIDDIESGNVKSSIQKVNAYELYDRYVSLGGNSYVHDHWERLRKEGKLWKLRML